ncbi:RAMP superfamily CRISPR-associated protein [Sorangium sp. So ce1504]|uniref:RAMP superfamily CRISPR-associated protein n=1 Tax=Sorangium sp. So ce1504 TaxID=3133337 RepID=UPI003F5FF1E9
MKLRTWFSGVVETRTALHIGTGTVLSTATDAPVIRGADGRPLIPGSSVKGALRSASERLLRALGQRSCVVFGDDRSADPTLRCLTTDKEGRDLFFKLRSGDADLEKARNRFSPPADWGPEPWKDFGRKEERQLYLLEAKEELCRACLTWGSQFLAGRVRVPDLRLSTRAGDVAWSGVTEIRDGVGIDRDTGTAAPGIKFDLEVLPAGARFSFELVVEPDADLAVVALAVGELRQGNIPLGGRVTRGLGDVALTEFAIHEVDLARPEQLVPYLTRGTRKTYEREHADEKLEEILTRVTETRDAA